MLCAAVLLAISEFLKSKTSHRQFLPLEATRVQSSDNCFGYLQFADKLYWISMLFEIIFPMLKKRKSVNYFFS